jgi:uncharacterized protein YbjT (DUF2867 family)
MILLAGGTGTLGRKVIPLLVARGLGCRVLARNADRAGDLGTGVEIVAADIRDRAAVDRAMQGVDTVVSMIQGFGGADALGARTVDRDGNLTLIEAAAAAGVRHMVLLSIDQAAPDHPSELFRMKHAAEAALKSSGLRWTIIRPTAYMETWLGLVGRPLVTTGRTRVFGRGKNPINFVAADDVARFVEMAVVDPSMEGSTMVLAGPQDLTFDQFTAVVGEVAGRSGRVDHAPRALLRILSTVLQPIRPILAGQIGTALVMDTRDMRSDAGPRQRLAPSIPVTPLADVARREFAAEVASRPDEGPA